jgi:hypothetical protein
MEPCGIPSCVCQGMDILSSTVSLNYLLERNELISLIKVDIKCNLDTLYSKPGCHVVSKISKKPAAVDLQLLKFRVMWCISLMH